MFATLALPTCAKAQGSISVDNSAAQDSLSEIAARLFGQRMVRISLPTDAPDLILLEPHLIGDTLDFARDAPGAWTLDTATAWLNNVISVGVYRSLPRIIAYRVYRIP